MGAGTFSKYRTNSDKEKGGVRLETSGGTFIVRRKGSSNKPYMRALNRLFRPWRRALATGQMDYEKREELELVAFIDHILVGWEDDVSWPVKEDGSFCTLEEARALPEGDIEERSLPFNKANARMVLSVTDLFEEIDFGASSPETFRSFEREQDSGN